YLGNAFLYSRFSERSHFDQNVNADAAFNFSKLSIRGGSAFRAATEEPTAVVTPTNFTIGRQRFYYRTTPYLHAAYKMADRWRIEGNYQFDDLSFPKKIDRIDDYQYNTFGTTLFYKFWPKTSALVQYVAVTRTHPFDSTRDNVVHTPLVGLTWEPTAKLSGTVKFGYTIANYTNNLPGLQSSTNSWALSIQTLYKISRFTQLSLIAQRGIQEDADFANNGYINSLIIGTISMLLLMPLFRTIIMHILTNHLIPSRGSW
ncbi:MAG: outer membrane beta-barrel protein, partial [Deltaproteobacteria bacterium]|nr:outer membrane beta-barrel protein [Deltaproteobacteria bacterium]